MSSSAREVCLRYEGGTKKRTALDDANGQMEIVDGLLFARGGYLGIEHSLYIYVSQLENTRY